MNLFKSRHLTVGPRRAERSNPRRDLLALTALLGAGAALLAAAWAWRYPRGVGRAAPVEPHEIDRWSNEGGLTGAALELARSRQA